MSFPKRFSNRFEEKLTQFLEFSSGLSQLLFSFFLIFLFFLHFPICSFYSFSIPFFHSFLWSLYSLGISSLELPTTLENYDNFRRFAEEMPTWKECQPEGMPIHQSRSSKILKVENGEFLVVIFIRLDYSICIAVD